MNRQTVIFLFILAIAPATLHAAQQEEVRLERAREKITTVSAMRVRSAPQASSDEVGRLKLGTTVNAIARSMNQDTIGGKTDYWYRVDLPNNQTGWLFGGLLLDYSAAQRVQLLRDIIGARLKAENTEFADRQEIYNLAARAITEAKDTNTRAEFELLKLLAIANVAATVDVQNVNKSPYREWYKTHAAELVLNEFAGGYNLKSQLLWNLETKYHALPISDRIAWEAAQNPLPSDCEGDEVCDFFVISESIKYLDLHPNGAHAAEALQGLTDGLTDEVITAANSTNGDQYAAQQRSELRKTLVSLRTVVAKTSAPPKSELIKKLQRVKL